MLRFFCFFFSYFFFNIRASYGIDKNGLFCYCQIVLENRQLARFVMQLHNLKPMVAFLLLFFQLADATDDWWYNCGGGTMRQYIWCKWAITILDIRPFFSLFFSFTVRGNQKKRRTTKHSKTFWPKWWCLLILFVLNKQQLTWTKPHIKIKHQD